PSPPRRSGHRCAASFSSAPGSVTPGTPASRSDMSDDTLVLHGARIIDGTGAEPVRGRAVLVEGGRITAVVEEARAPRGRGVDLAGSTLLPGLINCHVHLCFGAAADPVRPV